MSRDLADLEGAECENCGEATYEVSQSVNCSCHINPPCEYCVEDWLECPACNHRPGLEDAD